MKRVQNGPAKPGFTLTELLITLGIIAALAALVLPILVSARSRAHRATCLSNMRQLGAALLLYAQDNDGYFCPTVSDDHGKHWDRLLCASVKNKTVFRCPSCAVPASAEVSFPEAASGEAKGYALNAELYNERTRIRPEITDASVRFPANTVALCEVGYRATSSGGNAIRIYQSRPETGDDLETLHQTELHFIGSPGGLRHHSGSNYAFADGHARWFTPNQILGADKSNDGQKPSFAL